ncbi:zinc finger protein 410-like [Anneissia japonica]|uniref:zinc finger protein 410-like n=1 Tax=Anneissia japonica TaxID=1529436 RepID=UPI00142557B5|nr:zinc finger protein 410-like [Anneissia japonica]
MATTSKNTYTASLSVDFLAMPLHHETVATSTPPKVINLNEDNIRIDFSDDPDGNDNLLNIGTGDQNMDRAIAADTMIEGTVDESQIVEDSQMNEAQTDMANTASQPSYLLFSIPNPSQTPLLDMPVYVLSNHLAKDNIDANVVLEQQKKSVDHMVHLQELAHANLISATQESIARTFGMEVPDDKKVRKLYICKECGRGFKSSTNRKYHMELHKGNKVLKCTFPGCERRFSWPTHLQYHLKTHTNNRQYVCDVPNCAKAFFTEQRLVVHRRTHTGIRPFSCTEKGCNKSFTTAGNLRNHIRTHTGEKPYVCNVAGCLVQFTERSSLRKHMLTHTGEKPYKCEVCEKMFTQIGSRNTHMKRKHANTDINSPLNLVDKTLIGENLVQLQDHIPYTSLSHGTVSASNAAVVVLSEPHTSVTLTNTRHLHHQAVSREDMVYGNDLLQSELDQNISHNIHVSGDMVGTHELPGVHGMLPSQKGIVGVDTMIHGNRSDDGSNEDNEESLRNASREMYCP